MLSPRSDVRVRVRGLYGIADATASGGDPEALGRALLEGGCRLIQLRCKGWLQADLLRVARVLRAQCHAVGATFIVNDSAEVAVEADADGVHIGALDGDPALARRVLGPNRILGVSSNTPSVAAALAEVADYVAFGPLWATANDDGRQKPPRGTEALAQARARIPAGTPLVAIGGITTERLPAVIGGGANAWAVIGAIAGAPDPVAATAALCARACSSR